MSLAAVLLLALGTGCSSGSSESGSSEKDRVAGKPGGGSGAVTSATKSPDGRPVDIVRAAVAKARATSARIDGTVVVRGGDGESVLSLAGPFDLAADRGRLSVDLPDGAVDHMDEVFDEGKVYLSQGVPQGHWAVIDRAKARAHSLLRAPLNDPEHVLRQASAIRDVSDRGTTTIDGRPVHLFGGTLDHRTLTSAWRTSTASGSTRPGRRWAAGCPRPRWSGWTRRGGRPGSSCPQRCPRKASSSP
ncbi:hypothetical protein [Streptomyces demainii]|uniref:LppX_LprAFG lipoprotein n=1 Tax=Streptomyces demainii TaxID=588122 RepID=A0ABT9KKS8_9ACTN|nr:hypothetical protein [Streptomyces demainii]MDP9608137.1 hypothetical protein [Streptomyces demainii]